MANLNHKWLVYTRGTIPLHRIALFKALTTDAHKYYGEIFKTTFYINTGPKLWWSWDEKEMIAVGRFILEKTKDEKGKKRYFGLMDKVWMKAINVSEKIFRKDLKKLGNKDLIRFYDLLKIETAPGMAFLSVDIDAVDFYPVEALRHMIKKELPKMPENEFIIIYNKLTAPAHKSYINGQEELILRAAKKLNKDKKLMQRFEKGDHSGIKEMKELMKKFWWTALGWENVRPNTEKSFAEIIKEHLKDGNIGQKLKNLMGHVKNVKKERDGIIKKYNLSKELQYRLRLFDEYALWHDRRKEMQVKTLYAAHLLLCEAARRRDYDINDLEWLWHEEVQDILRGKELDKKEVERRKKGIAVLIDGKEITQWSGDEAIKIKEKVAPEKTHDLTEIRGEPASSGIAKGIARVCAGAEEAMKKVKKGDILVCGMTLPDYVPAMKRAAAIVTDEGGITCHAAIISRELGVPCITGTKIATQAIKDGDLLEVNANEGIIKIIK